MSRTWLAALLVLVGCAGAAGGPSTTSQETASTTTSASSTTSTATTLVTTTTDPGPEVHTYLVWTSGGMTDGLVAGIQANFDTVSVVTGDLVELDDGGGQVVPLDAIGLDVAAHTAFYPRDAIDSLRNGTVLLSETSASYRGLAPGDSLTIDGVGFEVSAVAPDEAVGAAEVVFARGDPESPVDTARYALVLTQLERTDFEELVESLNDAPVPPRILEEGEAPYLRHADSVLPQNFIKIDLGEFSYPAGSGPDLVPDADWVESNIVTAEVPMLGMLTCHRDVVDMVTGAFNQLIDEGLEDLVDPSGFAGCWVPRFIRNVTGTPIGVSRHSWGAALDINAPTNRLGTEGDQDPRLVEIMETWGFGWGGDWTVPDPMHFEYEIWPED